MKKIAILTALIVLMGFVGSVQADGITVNDPLWYEFEFSAVGVPAIEGSATTPSSGGNSQFAPDAPWTFSLGVPTFLVVVDAFQHGDVFQVLDFGSPIGQTTAVAVDSTSTTSDPAVAFLDPTYSRGTFFLFAGAHSLTIAPTVSPFGGGAGYFRVSTSCPCPAPVPGTLMLLSSALIGLVGIGLRRKS